MVLPSSVHVFVCLDVFCALVILLLFVCLFVRLFVCVVWPSFVHVCVCVLLCVVCLFLRVCGLAVFGSCVCLF